MLAIFPPISSVQLHGAEGADWKPLVRVDCNTEEAGVGVDEPFFPDGGKVGDELLGVLSLSCTRLSSCNDGLVVQ